MYGRSTAAPHVRKMKRLLRAVILSEAKDLNRKTPNLQSQSALAKIAATWKLKNPAVKNVLRPCPTPNPSVKLSPSTHARKF